MSHPSDLPIRSLGERIEVHAQAEQHAINRYRQIAAGCPDRLVGQLMLLILEDEQHHHAALRRMASILEHENPASTPLSSSPQLSPDTADELARFAREEHDGAAQLRELALEAGTSAEGLVKLVLELMARDSEKHALILRFAVERLHENAQASA